MEKLASDEVEDQLNAQTIITDNIENKKYFNIISQPDQLDRLFKIAFTSENAQSRKSGIQVIKQVVSTLLEKHRNSQDMNADGDDQKGDKMGQNMADDDVIVQEEQNQVETKEEIAIAKVLAEYLPRFRDQLLLV